MGSLSEMLKTRGKEYNCYECIYQGTNETKLKKHMNLKYILAGNTDGNIKCGNCGELFTSK